MPTSAATNALTGGTDGLIYTATAMFITAILITRYYTGGKRGLT